MENLREKVLVLHQHMVDGMNQSDGDGFAPMCVLVFEDFTIPCVMGGVEAGSLNDACKMAIKAVYEKVIPEIEEKDDTIVGPLQCVIIHTDTYLESVNGAESESNYKWSRAFSRKSLAERFAMGDTRVKECVVSVAISPDETLQVMQVYRYLPSEGYEWEDPDVMESSADERWNWESMTGGVS